MMDLLSILGGPALPVASTLPGWVAGSWGVCIAALLSVAARAWGWRILKGLAVAALLCAVWASVWPGEIDWIAQLALAFQTPSAVTLLALAWWAWGVHVPGRHGIRAATLADAWWGAWALGWALWFDTFNRWPQGWDISLYDWGFGAPAMWFAALCVWASAAWMWRRTQTLARIHVVLALALLLYALTRWPTGNVWDALLDPWLWFAANAYALRRLWAYWRGERTSKYSRQNNKVSGE